MADAVQVSCINKRDRQDRWERISHVGGVNADGNRWKLTEEAAIKGIADGKWKFYTHVDGKSAWVIIATHNGRKYLKTEADTSTKDNLLSLPECP
jgi:Protein of unknown function (DUF3892)